LRTASDLARRVLGSACASSTGFPRPATRIHVVDEMARDRYIDMGYRRLLIANEYDGREFHRSDGDRGHG
jgi:hypothetical protein